MLFCVMFRRRVIVVRGHGQRRHNHYGYDDHQQHGFEGSVTVVKEKQHYPHPDVLVVDHGGADYIQPVQAVVPVQAAPTFVVPAAAAAANAPAAIVPASSNYPSSSSIDPR